MPQADIFRPMRLPAVLVGDHRLGGIASTISAAESLILRGYDIDAVICFDDKSKYQNGEYLKGYFEKMGIPAFELPWVPSGIDECEEKEERERMADYYQRASKSDQAHQVAENIIDRHSGRFSKMENMASRTNDIIWHPFTQHKHVETADDLLVFDSAYGDYFQVKKTSKSQQHTQNEGETSLLYPAFDGSASWWTQGLGHGNSRLALEAAHAAGRYGHIMFAGATHEPALTLAERLIKGLENPRLKKVFYTDDGSTATEVGIKMGLRAACVHYGWNGSQENIGVLGLKGSYHGDTIGAMDASEPCVFNEKVDWYRGRGYWFDYPTFKMRKGRWVIEPPSGMEKEFGTAEHFENLGDIFDLGNRGHSLQYESYIERTLDDLVKKRGMKFGALVMEPVILGAGGMIFVDPLFQQSLVRVVRRYNFSSSSENTASTRTDEHAWSGLPVVFDEVFTGLYRLGRFSSASYLGVHPDISVHAKLLTGGLLPLSITAASESIFQAFWGDKKSDALLHGHSYTAHPVGCHVANTSLETMGTLQTSPTWLGYKRDWQAASVAEQDGDTNGKQITNGKKIDSESNAEAMWSMWSKDFVLALSNHERVDCVNAMGSVLAVTLVDTSGSGELWASCPVDCSRLSTC
jgi:dethiobiotin synthetase/adenosylmethionine--8-amino-7-oxononanoate aminotransferase